MPRSKPDDSLEADWKRITPSSTGGKGHARYLVNKEFGHLKVLNREGSDKNGASLWKCLCQLCGTEKVYSRPALTSGRVKSCGCLKASLIGKPRPKPTDKPKFKPRKNVWQRLLDD
jgi:hypothetical protein